MAEALGVAASAISVIAFAGQLAQGFAQLYTLFGNYRHAFSEVERLLTELRLVSSILATIGQSFGGGHTDPDLELALKHCDVIVNQLSQIATTLGPVQGAKKRQLLRKQVKATLKLPELAKHAAELERAKSMLVQCCANATRELQVGDSSVLHGIRSSLTEVATRQSAVADSIVETRAAVESLDGPLARLETKVSNTHDIAESLRATTSGLESSSSRVEEMQLKTYTIAKRLEAGSSGLREQTQTVKLVSREIVGQVQTGFPVFRQALAQDMEQAISTGLRQIRRDIRKTLTEQAGTPLQGVGRKSEGGNNAVFKRHILSTPHSQDHPSPKQAPLDFQSQYVPAAAPWKRMSSAVSWDRVVNLTLFGTLIARMTTVSYARRRSAVSDGDPDTETREESQTSITFLPARWLSIAGAKFRYGSINHPAPAWSLQSVNVVPDDSEIFRCCIALDLDGMRGLFDERRASPFDVNESGRTLLGYLAVGLATLDVKSRLEMPMYQIRQRLHKLFAMVDLLVGYGLDVGELELAERKLNPMLLFVLLWFGRGSDLAPVFCDDQQFLLDKLLKSAKSDPLVAFHFPVSLYMPGLPARRLEIAPSALQLLTRQEEWPMPSQDVQIASMCDLGHRGFNGYTRNYVGFWVTSTCQEVEQSLQIKIEHLRLLIRLKGRCPWEDLLRITIHGGAEVIAMLSMHPHPQRKPPWLRHRFQKLVLVRQYLVRALKLMLQEGGKTVADLQVLGEVSRYAQTYDARTFCAWRTALEEAARDLGTTCALAHEYRHGGSRGWRNNADDGRTPDTSATEHGDWETEEHDSSDGSGWETEEEWEGEGYMLHAAVDRGRPDDANPELRPPNNRPRYGTHIGADISPDYNEGYWWYVYAWIERLDTGSKEPERLGKKAMNVARAVRNVVSYIV